MVKQTIVLKKLAILFGIAFICFNVSAVTLKPIPLVYRPTEKVTVESDIIKEVSFIASWLRSIEYENPSIDTTKVADSLESAFITLYSKDFKQSPYSFAKGPIKAVIRTNIAWADIERAEPIEETVEIEIDDNPSINDYLLLTCLCIGIVCLLVAFFLARFKRRLE